MPRLDLFRKDARHACRLDLFRGAVSSLRLRQSCDKFRRLFGGYARTNEKGSPIPRLASLFRKTRGHRAGGRIRDYPSQKDPIPEVTLQRRVPLCCSWSQNVKQTARLIRTFASCSGPAQFHDGTHATTDRGRRRCEKPTPKGA